MYAMEKKMGEWMILLYTLTPCKINKKKILKHLMTFYTKDRRTMGLWSHKISFL
jgi:hypothetical protein